MRRVAVILTILALFLPLVAWADGIDIVNKNGTVTILESGISSHGSHLTQYNNIKATPGHGLGYVSYSTGALLTGSLLGGGTFSSIGSSFLVTGTGGYPGVPKGIVFSGAFVGDISWTLIQGLPNKPQIYQLAGDIKGQLYDGRTVTGSTTQTIYVYYNQVIKDHKGGIHLGDTHLNVPEPGTLGLMGIGLLAMAGTIRRRFAA